MKLAFITLNDSANVHQWSGLNFHIARSLERAGATLHRIGPLDAQWSTAMRVRQRWFDATGRAYHAAMEPGSLDQIGAQARALIPDSVDGVLAVTSLVAAAIGPIDKPFASWDDATNAAMADYYPDFVHMAPISRRHASAMGERAAKAVDLAIYASHWAAASARESYGMAENAVAVVPFGANIDELPGDTAVEVAIVERPDDVCRLLWVGVDWERKGGQLAVEIASLIHKDGVTVELALVGCDPPNRSSMPKWIDFEGFVSKRTPEGAKHLARSFARAHFFVMPSHAEAYGLVYAEAAAYGVPAVAIRTGGVPTIIEDGVTGILESPNATAADFAKRILELWNDRARYNSMAQAARQRSKSLLNWDVAGKRVLELMRGLG